MDRDCSNFYFFLRLKGEPLFIDLLTPLWQVALDHAEVGNLCLWFFLFSVSDRSVGSRSVGSRSFSISLFLVFITFLLFVLLLVITLSLLITALDNHNTAVKAFNSITMQFLIIISLFRI